MQPPPEHQRMIDYFTARGLHAAFRQWEAGPTVFVAAGGDPSDTATFTRMAYLVPDADGRWAIHVMGIPSDERFDDAAAQAFVERVLASREAHEAECQRRLLALVNAKRDDESA